MQPLPHVTPSFLFKHRTSFVDLTGKRFGRWTVLAQTLTKLGDQSLWHCRCDCGNEKSGVRYGALTTGASQSCGCLRREKIKRPDHLVHSQRNPTYRSWQNMRTRCYNVNHPSYAGHGARGITMCDEWLRGFDAFLKDMGPRPAGKSIERRDNNGPYAPWNCEWATPKQQASNTRRNFKVEYGGKEMILMQVAELENVDYAILRRLCTETTMTVEEAVASVRNDGHRFFDRTTGTSKSGKTRKRNPSSEEFPTDFTGKRFGRWFVLGRAPNSRVKWSCRCDCGKEKRVASTHLTQGKSQSCGCLRREKRIASGKGKTKSPLYSVWQSMKTKCYNPRHHTYVSGITVAPEWLHNFDAFLKDMGDRPEGHTLGRRDTTLPFSPANCLWVKTRSEKIR